jgi:hypothetical protein
MKRQTKIIVNVIIFALLALVVSLALMTFRMPGEGERVNLPSGRPAPVASPK